MKKPETPRERFKRLATLRVNAVLQKLEILGNCSNRNYYEYTEDDVNVIFNAIDKKVKEIKLLFRFPKKERFTL
jgi:hypothetical protein